MTETTCTGTCMGPEDQSVGRVGPPMAGIEVKLVNWEEGNYRVSDRYWLKSIQITRGGDTANRSPEKSPCNGGL